jgi:AraC-like DNA-binding protein
MGFTNAQVNQLALTFPKEHAEQIAVKAAHHNEPFDDVFQEISEIILDVGQKYDPAKGSLTQFIFGHWERRNRRTIGPLRYAISIDQNNDYGKQIRELVESIPAEHDEKNYDVLSASSAPWAKTVHAILELISGNSFEELAQHLGLTRRRVQQIFQRLCEAKLDSPEFESQAKTLHARLLKCMM